MGGGAHPNDWRAVAKVNRVRMPRGCSVKRTALGGEKVDIRAFGVAREWKPTALEAELWVKTATEIGRRFMAAWRK